MARTEREAVKGRPGAKKRFLKPLIIFGSLVIGIPLLAGFAMRTFQEHFVYAPAQSQAGPAHLVYFHHGEDLSLQTDDGLTLTAWLVHPTPDAVDRNEAVILFPSQTGNRSMRTTLGQRLAEQGFTVLMFDYRGFGGNPGTTTAAGALLDATAAQRALSDAGFPADRTIYYGESIGAAIAAQLAATAPPAGMILRSPFPEYAYVASEYLPLPVPLIRWLFNRAEFQTEEFVATSDVPTIVLWGTADTVVPPALSEQVADRVLNLVDQFPLSGATHTDRAWQSPFVVNLIERLADETIAPTG